MCCDVADDMECSQQPPMASPAAGPSAANAAHLQHDSSLHARVQNDEADSVGSSGDRIQQASPSTCHPTHSHAAAQATLLQHAHDLQGDHGRGTT